jgi:hypothetical protein
MKLVCEIAEAFNTTLTATAVRLVEESKDDCAVVFSQMGLVRWYRRSNTGFNFFLQSNTPLRDTSRAFECGTEPSRSRGPRPVPLEAWIFNPRYGEELEIWEESVFLPEYQTVITLLGFN